MRNKTKEQKKRPAVTFDMDDELKDWLTKEKEAAEKVLGGKADIKMPVLIKSKLRARMADEKKGS